jgi:RNA polymerase sigma-70 factor (ECF subfamily)
MGTHRRPALLNQCSETFLNRRSTRQALRAYPCHDRRPDSATNRQPLGHRTEVMAGLVADGSPVRRTSGVLDHDDDVREAYDAHGAELYRFALRSLGDAGAAQDAVQETFLRAWRASARFDPQLASLRGWLFAILRNVIIDSYRAEGSRPRLQTVQAGWREDQRDPRAMDLDSSADVLRSHVVQEALRRIGVDHRDALVQTYLLDRPYEIVAAELGIPASTLRSRVFYGLKALRVVLEEMEVEL